MWKTFGSENLHSVVLFFILFIHEQQHFVYPHKMLVDLIVANTDRISKSFWFIYFDQWSLISFWKVKSDMFINSYS